MGREEFISVAEDPVKIAGLPPYFDATKLTAMPDIKNVPEDTSNGVLRALLHEYGTIIDEPIYDDAGNRIPCEFVISTDRMDQVVELLTEAGRSVFMVGARTSATGNFNPSGISRRESMSKLIGIKAKSLNGIDNIPYSLADRQSPNVCRSNEIIINKETRTVRVGSGVTITQLNSAIADELGDNFYVPLDLTTTDIAHAGAVLATGAQGPGRFQAADLAVCVKLHDGQHLRIITQPDEIRDIQGKWGMTGAIIEQEFTIVERPSKRFALFVPLNGASESNWDECASQVLAMMHPALSTKIENGKIISDWDEGILDGAEVIAKNALDLVLSRDDFSGVHSKASQLLHSLALSDSQRGILFTGYSVAANWEVLSDLTGENSPISALMELSEEGCPVNGHHMHAAVVNKGELEGFRILRESLAFAARANGRENIFSASTDINSRVNPEFARNSTPQQIQVRIRQLLEPYKLFGLKIDALAAEVKSYGIQISRQSYGHENTKYINEHSRVTVAAQGGVEPSKIENVLGQIKLLRAQMLEALIALRNNEPDIFEVTGGEKGDVTNEAFDLATDDVRQKVATILASGPTNFQVQMPTKWRGIVLGHREAA